MVRAASISRLSAAALLRTARSVAGSTSRVFPLPVQSDPRSSRTPRSRREQQRHRNRCRLVTILNVVIMALNVMALGSFSSTAHPLSHHSSTSVGSSYVSSLQTRIIANLFISVRSFGAGVRRRKQPSGTTERLPGLCDSLFRWISSIFTSVSPLSISVNPSSLYSHFPYATPMVGWEADQGFTIPNSYLRSVRLRDRAKPVVANRVALPSDLKPVPLLSILSPDKRALYAEPSDALLLPTPRKVNRVPRVFGSFVEYVKLVRRLLAIGMSTLTLEPKVVNGAFCVDKDSESDRFIVDGVFANAWFKEPSKTRLPDPSSLANLVHRTDAPIFVAKSDLSNFYHHLALPEWIRPYFCLPGVPANLLGIPGDHLVYPMLLTVPMGWSHAVAVAQDAHENVLYSAGAIDRANDIASTVSHTKPRVMTPSATLHGIYIDDAFFLSLSEDKCNAALDASLDAYAKVGLVVKQSKVVRASCTGVEVLGLLIDGVHATVSLSASSRIEVVSEVLQTLSRPYITGLQLASVVGKLTWAMLVRRPSLQCLHHSYRFIRVRKNYRSQLWPSVIRELLVAVALLPLLSANLRRDFVDRVVCTDASEIGGAVLSKPSERTEAWSTIIQHRWKWPEHINALEMRTIQLALIWLVTNRLVNCRIRLLTDSMVSLCILNKGRTSSPTVGRIHTVVAALLLASGIVFELEHVRSELNPADGPSRFV